MSTSPISLHPTPSAGFDQPFEMLAECHGRVERMLSLLERLQAHLGTHGADGQAQGAARDVMRYFDEAAPRHHEDEERHVFPLLAASGQAELAARLLAEHAEMALAWAQARAPLAEVAGGLWHIEDATRVWPVWGAFAALYRRHVEAEDRLAYPAASTLIDEARLALMRDDMAARRGVDRAARLDEGQASDPGTAGNRRPATRSSRGPGRP